MKKLSMITEGAIMIALSAILSMFPLFQMPLGGDVTFVSSLPLCVYAYRRGVKNGLLAAFVYSLFQLLLGLKNLSYATGFASAAAIIFCDYILPYSFLFLGAVFSSVCFSKKERLSGGISLSLGVLSAMIMRFLCHFVSGAVVWYGLTKVWYQDDPGHIVFSLSTWDYSFVYNISYMLPETIATVVVGFVLGTILNFKEPNLLYKTRHIGK